MFQRSSSIPQDQNIPHQPEDPAKKDIRQFGMTDEFVDHFIQSSTQADEFIDHLIHSSCQPEHLLGGAMSGSLAGHMIHQLGSIGKLVELAELKEKYDEGVEHGHSSFASYLGVGAGMMAGGATFAAGAGLAAAGVLAAPEALPVGVAAITGGALLMHKSEEVAQNARHDVPIIVDATLDKFSDLYTSAVQFVQQAYWGYVAGGVFSGVDVSNRQYTDIESAMLYLGYKQHVESFYSDLSQHQQLLYSTITRDLFKEQFSLNGNRLQCGEMIASKGMKNNVDKAGLKQDIIKVQTKLSHEYDHKGKQQLNDEIKKQNNQLKSKLSPLVDHANKQRIAGSTAPNVRKPQNDMVREAHQFCEMYNAAAQGVAFLAHIGGNHRVANQIAASAMGVSQVVMGIAQIAQNGLAFGPVGMVFGGMNALISCFGSSGGDSGFSALAEQLAIISNQIHALHEDMLLQFGRVFTALGIINTNIIEGFKLLHEDQERILVNVMKLQKSVSTLQDSVNTVGRKIDDLSSELQGYVIDDDRKQLLFILNSAREKIRRDFNRAELHTQVMSGFKTYNENQVRKQLSAERATPAELSKALTIKLGSAEANTGLLLNYARTRLEIPVSFPIADSESWRQCADVLIQMTDMVSSREDRRDVIGKQDYEDFKHLSVIGENWLALIEHFKSKPDRENALAVLFQHYRQQVNNLIAIVRGEIERSEQETRLTLMPKYQGHEDFNKQKEFKYDFKRNYYYLTFTEDWSGCKGFHNGARYMGYDLYGGEWASHLESRKKELIERFEKYKGELDRFRSVYDDRNNYVAYYNKEEASARTRLTVSAFMVSELSPETMPLLPLPYSHFMLFTQHELSAKQIPAIFIQAEKLGIGAIKHVYKFENNEFIYKIQFHITGEKDPIIIRQYNKACTLPAYLNPAEAVWHVYMGGTYPSSGSHALQVRSCTSPNGDYHVRHYCAMPTIAAQDGLRKTLELSRETPKVQAAPALQAMIEARVKQKMVSLRQVMNQKIIQGFESLDARNPFANALLEVDAQAKVLIAFLSILFRDDYQKPACVWTREDILDFVKLYQSQDVYLIHQLETNLEVLQLVERMLLERVNLQTESAYTPVRETLKKLIQFMTIYEAHVMDDQVLAARTRVEQNRDAVQYGAAQAALVLQGELIHGGHHDAALHIARLLTRSGMGVLSITSPEGTARAVSSLSQQSFFAITQQPTDANVNITVNNSNPKI